MNFLRANIMITWYQIVYYRESTDSTVKERVLAFGSGDGVANIPEGFTLLSCEEV